MFAFFSKSRPAPAGEALSGPQDIQHEDEVVEISPLEGLGFRHPLRKYQKEILELIKLKLSRGERQLHIVAPPGAGKTIIGLQLITELKENALVVCPTTTIQAQWGQKLDLFTPVGQEDFNLQEIIGTAEDKPLKPITLLTYQVLSTPGREQEYLTKLAHQEWVNELVQSTKISQGEAELRILDIMANNKRAYTKELSRHQSRLRRKLTDVIDLKEVLHKNALDLLQALRRQKFKTIIFDECHHLTDYWAAVMTHVIRKLDDPIVIGLTGTPPEGKSASQENRYITLVGEIDYQVPTPALVKEGGLAPFQDLVYITQPTEKEDQFLEQQHEEFHSLLTELMEADPPLLTQWVQERLDQAAKDDWDEFAQRRERLVNAMGRYLYKLQLPLPHQIAMSPLVRQSPVIEDWMALLEDFSLNYLKVSASTDNHDLYGRIRGAISKLGYGLTERGIRKQASPVDRVLAFSQSKPEAVAKILDTEYRNLGDRLRCAVVTDFEKMSATAVKSAKGVLTPDSGGAVAVLRQLLKEPIGEYINPCLCTGSLLLVDRRIAGQFLEAATEYLRDNGYSITPILKEHTLARIAWEVAQQDKQEASAAGAEDEDENENANENENKSAEDASDEFSGIIEFHGDDCMIQALEEEAVSALFTESADHSHTSANRGNDLDESESDGDGAQPEICPYIEITAAGSDWESRLYVGMATHILERGITKCLIGTRGIFGEGWDCQALNTLIDLTTTTTPMSVKQLRGRSIRINVTDPLGARKVANNWDVVCIAPHLEKGLNDYQRFVRKHDGYFGISDDGQIECGVGHVHPAFSDLTPAEVFAQSEDFNEEMMNRALIRESIFDLWKVGEPYHNRQLGCVEISGLRKLALTPPNLKRDLSYKEHAQLMRASLNGLWVEYGFLASLSTAALGFFLNSAGASLIPCAVPLLTFLALGRKRYVVMYNRFKEETCRPNTQDSSLFDVAHAVLIGLQKGRFVPRHITKDSIKVSRRSDGSYRVFLDDVEPQQAEYFAKSFREVMSPVTNQPYIIAKYEFSFPKQKESRFRLPWKKERPPLENSDENYMSEESFFKAYINGKAQPRVTSYHPVPSLLARSERGREGFQSAWNKYVSPGFIIQTEQKPELVKKYFGVGPSLAQRLLWE